ncbi:MAG TPA: thioredoxin domain-containing protein [Pyrinomonadaceae bacterium]
MKRYLPLIIIVGVLSVALAAGVTMWRSSKQSSSASQPFTQPTPATTASQPVAPNRTPVPPTGQTMAASVHVRGAANAKVTLEEYGDYQCPPCGLLFHDLKAIEKEYGSQMRFVFRHFPLSGHIHARTAAHAAEAAGLQGRFWEMHDMIYQNQMSWSSAVDARSFFIQYARDLRLDVDRFTRDMNSPEVAARVTSDYDRGMSLGVTGTPTIYMNGQLVNSAAYTPDGLRKGLDYLLGKAK